ncbi:putative aflatoxin biosynthesis ketoreductase nor-1 [Lophiostoma macrostomum CBS 122681]|uniref:Putative aflatoxin biosynthesis ketoreductase nor-1 n=1 Tax=Lophiostoma macrostomum CBS 122681 TaxID=1314788 RepID=A0A6A6SXN5_9PLEO|nr:putative aflatoxin biosynthesis ketoreductase nor-1 [Lophiostoma macrostomum CBS 122681]
MAAKTTVLITGANRAGLGYGLAEIYLARPNHTVIGAVRNPSTATALKALPTGSGSSLIIIKIDSVSSTDPATAIEEIKSQGITAVDIVIANAGISQVFPPVHELEISDLLEHLQVNVFGVILLFKAVRPLLLAATQPKFVTLGTSAASLSEMATRNFPNSVYGTSKVALNYITLKTHFENPTLTAFPLDPGYVCDTIGGFAR